VGGGEVPHARHASCAWGGVARALAGLRRSYVCYSSFPSCSGSRGARGGSSRRAHALGGSALGVASGLAAGRGVRGAPSASSLRAYGAALRALLAPYSCSLRAFGAALRVNGGVSLRRGRGWGRRVGSYCTTLPRGIWRRDNTGACKCLGGGLALRARRGEVGIERLCERCDGRGERRGTLVEAATKGES
jgi:hypothetical protein